MSTSGRIRKARRGLGLLASHERVQHSGEPRDDVMGSSGQHPGPPLISVVVPVYDVEKYLPTCLNSLLAQTHENLEVLVVDDGSPDGSAAIAEAYALKDTRVRVIRKANGGLGSARNAGLAEATGEFVAFVDSDDTVPRGAMGTMLRSLERTGSDFAVGNFRRVSGNHRWVPAWARAVHSEERLGITYRDMPGILQDVFAWNKLFRLDFFKKYVVGFPEGVRYEDQEATARAYLNARRFDVLTTIVYEWRSRPDDSSITQQKWRIGDLSDRLLVWNRLRDYLQDNADPETFRIWLARILGEDLRQYLEQVPRTSERYWSILQGGTESLASAASNRVWSRVEPHTRIVTMAVAEGRRELVQPLLAEIADTGPGFATKTTTEGVVAVPAYLEGMNLEIPESDLVLDDNLMVLHARVDSVRWRDPATLVVEGHAYIENLPSDDDSYQLTAAWVAVDGKQTLPAEVVRTTSSVAAVQARDSWHDRQGSGFTVTLDLTEMPLDTSQGVEASAWARWKLVVQVASQGVARSGVLTGKEIYTTIPPHLVGARHGVDLTPTDGLVVYRGVPTWLVEGLEVTGRRISGRIRNPQGLQPVRVRADTEHLPGHVTSAVRPDPLHEGWHEFSLELPVAPAPPVGGVVTWRIRARAKDGQFRRMNWPEDSEAFYATAPPRGRLHARLTSDGFVRLEEVPEWAVATSYVLQDESVEFTGYADPGRGPEPLLVLRGPKDVVFPDALYWESETLEFRVKFSLLSESRQMISSGGRGLRILPSNRAPSSLGIESSRRVEFLETVAPSLPREVTTDRARVTLDAARPAPQAWLTVGPPLRAEERSAFTRRALIDTVHHSQGKIDDGAVLFESFGGAACTDSSLALFKEMRSRRPSMQFYWAVKDASVSVPLGAESVVVGSRRYIQILHTCELLVNNAHFPHYFRKDPRQKYVQVWHGTPLKKIGKDVPGASLSISYRELMRREAQYWDVLLAQNDFAHEVLPNALGYKGIALNLGYPRNDALVTPAVDEVRRVVRSRLGIAPSERVVLYAPTWRDNHREPNLQYRLVSHLDFAWAKSRLGPATTLMLRGHSNTASLTSVGAEVLDVSRYPDINDLLLAADVLVTDYSSVMFDYCLTGKPIAFLVPDYREYRDITRGFYLDLEEIAPGPLLGTTNEVVDYVRSIGSDWSPSDDYGRFVAEFAPRDDGAAASRVMDELSRVLDL